MPCNTVQQSEVDLSKCDQNVMIAAFKRLGLANPYKTSVYTVVDGKSIVVRFSEGRAMISGSQDTAAMERHFKRLYSSQVVLEGASRFGWRVNIKDENRFTMQKG
jgi:hypothetical protein